MKEEWMQTWKIRISWNMKQNSISGGAFVFDCTIRYRIFHLDHFQLLLNEWISRKTVDGKEAIRKRRPQCFTHSRLWNEFSHYDFLLQEAGNARSRKLEPWRKKDADCSFDLRGEIVWLSRKLCVVQLFSTFQLFYGECFRLFKFSTFFNLFQLFSIFFPSVFHFFQPFSTFFNFVLQL